MALLASVFLSLTIAPAHADITCSEAISEAEISYGIPKHLLQAIALIESGRVNPSTSQLEPWTWTLNVDGKRQFYDHKEDALQALYHFGDKGRRRIDVGCMQINLGHHAGAFDTLEQPLDPEANVAYGASYLRALYTSVGSWSTAVSRYHSATPELAEPYQTRVMDKWRELGGQQIVLNLPPPSTLSGQYMRAQVIARVLRDAGLTVPTEHLYLQMQSENPPREAKDTRAAEEDQPVQAQPRSFFDVTTARENFFDPWAAPKAKEQDVVSREKTFTRLNTTKLRAKNKTFDTLNYLGIRHDKINRSVPGSRLSRMRKYAP